ncbi:pentatricopeptide repeat-containing protein At2g33680-like isoform X2 [Tripterygium wilfordii]|nr:pentatricopeptide repeat-containing protein At2g33680-like isoform X2 [Tripterygium wilfordii]
MFQRNNVSWTIMICGSTENGFYLDGFRFFYEMLDSGVLPDKFTFSAIIQNCIGLDCLELGKMVHAQVIVRGFACHTFVSTALLNMYSKLGEIENSSLVFRLMTEKNEVSWNAMISGFTSNGLYLEAFDLFLRMKDEGITPNMYTVVSVSKAVGKLGDVDKGTEVHQVASNLGVECTVLVGTALIDMYSKCGSLNDARSIFDKNFDACGVNMPWNSMISGYSQCGCSQEALELYVTMCQEDIKADLYTFGSIFNAIAALKNLRFGKEVHAMVLKYGDGLMVTNVQNALADAYAKCGSLEDVVKVFDRMKERDIVSWTTMVTAYAHCSEWDEALFTFSRMREDGFAPNHFTFSSVFASCASLCLLDYGRQVHGILCKAGLDSDMCIESALIDMYAKCGGIADAGKVFKRIPSPDNVSLTAMISAYAQHGFTEDALDLFMRMEQLGKKPTAVTLLCVLSACSHGGMVTEGLRYFKLMEEKYGSELDMEHYACVVDLLGRVGRLDDAMEFVRSMPINPNEIIWQTLLGACRIHGNIELAEVAAMKVLSARPEHSAAYVLLSNTYIETGSLADGHFLRDVMKKRGVKKEPGYSWISIEGGIHKFYSGDERHPEKDGIYTTLEDLNQKVKSMVCARSLSCTM